ncbi:MAG TPA: hypothetical protein VFV50_10485 [Bdellovibrionales bacterium]|nr:hypothetical protein [Bdellovibrionales bacterium]
MKASDWLLIAGTQNDAHRSIRNGSLAAILAAAVQAALSYDLQGSWVLVDASFIIVPALLLWSSKSVWPALLLFLVAGMALGSSFFNMVMQLPGGPNLLLSAALLTTGFQLVQAALLLRRPLVPPPAPAQQNTNSIAS